MISPQEVLNAASKKKNAALSISQIIRRVIFLLTTNAYLAIANQKAVPIFLIPTNRKDF